MAESKAQLALALAAPQSGPRRVAGVDEAGRGPLAGPLVVAAVVFAPGRTPINGLDDSKQLPPARREVLYQRIVERALAWKTVFVDAEEIDRINIYQATMLGMRRALEAVREVADLARIDGNAIPRGLPCPAEALVGGDARDRAIMAASILAKVERDRHMRALHAQWPQYGFDEHKGYSTPAHLQALARFGPCPQHRRSFAPVRAALRAREPGPAQAPAADGLAVAG
ncbi:ribonuclease HII [Vulcaniibacterium tengchongense]|uniref:Ribonuclease HII n=1 Tax=Vulcaniibacterium tengchongense TaxID=1273429 RepID=A0A3N4V3B1_9GAMM|nr:ribonuclease HII [Vulcaniibacterium tengchongense]RPE76958.1 RNase HII [Vulcaniibacterium tengchongense]